MDASDLKKLHADYRAAVTAARDESASDEARAAAGTDLVAKREALDAALIQNEQEREDDARLAAAEARDHAAALVAGTAPAPDDRSNLPLAEMRDFAEKKTNQVSFTINPPEQRSDITTAGSGVYGSYVVPQDWYTQVSMAALAQSGVLRAGPTIIQTEGDNQINMPRIDTDMTTGKTAEGTAAGATYPVFGTVPLNSYRIDGYVPISDEFMRSTNIDINGVLSALVGRSLGAKQAGYHASVAIGTGSSLPDSITYASVLGVTAVSQTTPTLDELKTLFYSLLPQYRANASWIGNSTLTLQVAVAKDDTGNYLWQPSNMAAEPDRLWGKPWFEDGYMAASTTGLKPLVFGDVKAGYVVRYAGGIEISFSRDFLFTTFETTMRWARWFDSASVELAAIHHLILA
jgi:HK97 family phage major capsid protein